LLGFAVAVLAAAVAVAVTRSRRRKNASQTASLRQAFGPEYDTAVGELGHSEAESNLLDRQERARLFPVRGLSQIEQNYFSEKWLAAQGKFVDEPEVAVRQAGDVVAEILSSQGYPAGEFERGATALSVDHPRAVQQYRTAHEVLDRSQRNAVTTEELRTAMSDYEAVFRELTGHH
jgi:hypothetical protein